MGGLRLLERVYLVVGEVQVERSGGFRQVMWLGRSDDRRGYDRAVQDPGQRDLGHARVAGFGNALDSVDHRLVEG